ncbi:MAG: hypothetical protein AAF206_20005 [Bacteroidota bacterium]
MRSLFSLSLLTLLMMGLAVAQTNEYEVVQVLTPQSIRLNSTGHALLQGGKARYALPVQLPPHTVSWYYVFSASRDEARMKANLNRFDALAELSKLIDQYGISANLINFLTVMPGSDYCNVYLATDGHAVRMFESEQGFQYNRMASRPNYESGKVEVKDQILGTQYLLLSNPDALSGVSVNIEVVAVVKRVPRDDNQVMIKNETDQPIRFMLSQGVGWTNHLILPKNHGSYPLLLKTGTVQIETEGRPAFVGTIQSYHDYYIGYNPQNQRFELFRY